MGAQQPPVDPALRGLIGHALADRYLLQEIIGLGTLGVVFKAHDQVRHRDVAIKLAHPTMAPDEVAQLAREAETAARLDHVHCLSTYESGTHEGLRFAVMPLLDGRRLSEALDDTNPVERTLDLGIQILRGLEYAHGQGIVHHDLVPKHVFLVTRSDGRETVKLTGFGLGPDTKIAPDGTMQGISGATDYLSPEEALGLPTDARSDLYSAGFIMYRLLAGTLPFVDEDPIVQLRRLITDEVPPLPESVPPMLARVVMRLVRKERDQRYETASDAVSDLEAFRSGAHLLPSEGGPVIPTAAAAPTPSAPGISGAYPGLAPPDPSPAPRIAGDQPPASQGTPPALDRGGPTVRPDGPGLLVWAGLGGVMILGAVTIGLVLGAKYAKPPPGTPPPVAHDEPGAEASTDELTSMAMLAAVNEIDPAAALDYRARHVRLAQLRQHARTARLIDDRLNIELDLLQAADSPTPCTTYRDTLARIASARDPYFLGALERSQPPRQGGVPLAGKYPDGSCQRLAEQRTELVASTTALVSAGGDARAHRRSSARKPNP